MIESQVFELEATDTVVDRIESVEDRIQERTPALEEPPTVGLPNLHDLDLEGEDQKEPEHVQQSDEI